MSCEKYTCKSEQIFYEIKCSSIDFGSVPISRLSSLAKMLKIELKVLPFFGWKFFNKKGEKNLNESNVMDTHPVYTIGILCDYRKCTD